MIDVAGITRAVEKSFEEAANDTLATMSERIFINGKKSDDTKAGEYSTKPLTVTGFGGRGGFFPGGYKQFKGSIGQENAFVNFRLTNNLQSDFNNSQSGFVLTETGNNAYGIVITRPENETKIKDLERKYGPTFTSLTESEQNLLTDSLAFNLANNLSEL